MKTKLTAAILVAAMGLIGCAAPMATPSYQGTLSGEAVNLKLGQDTPVSVRFEAGGAVVHFTDLTERDRPCEARFEPVRSQVAGAAVYRGDFEGAIGVCRIFAQDPGMERYLILGQVAGGANLAIGHDPLAREVMIRGQLH